MQMKIIAIENSKGVCPIVIIFLSSYVHVPHEINVIISNV